MRTRGHAVIGLPTAALFELQISSGFRESPICASWLCSGGLLRKRHRELSGVLSSGSLPKNLWHTIRHTSFEPLFTALTFFLSRLTRDPQILFIVTSLFSFAVTGRFLAKFSLAPCFSLYLFFTLQIFDFYISGIRQALAIALLLLAYEAMTQKKKSADTAVDLAGRSIPPHGLAVVSVFFLLRVRRRRAFLGVAALVGAVCLVSSRYLVAVIASIFPRYQLYFGSSYLKSGAKLSLILYFLVFGLVLLVGELVGDREDAPVRADETNGISVCRSCFWWCVSWAIQPRSSAAFCNISN